MPKKLVFAKQEKQTRMKVCWGSGETTRTAPMARDAGENDGCHRTSRSA